MDAKDRAELIRRMTDGGGSRAESFFLVRGLGAAFNSPGKGWGTQKRVNAALLAAEREGTIDDVLEDAAVEYGMETTRNRRLVARPRPATRHSAGPTGGRLFISHATADKSLASALSDLLRLGTDLSASRILCTSLEGMGIPEGDYDYPKYLRDSLNGAELVLPLLTPAFFDSDVCLIELGAMWGAELESFPIAVPPVDYARVERVLGKMQLSKIDDPAHLSRLHDRIVRKFGLKAKTDMWEVKRADFLAKLPSQLKSLTPASNVPVATHQAMVQKSEKLARRVKRLTNEKLALEEKLRAVAAAKTESEVAELLLPDDEIERFEALVAGAREQLGGLPGVVKKAFYENLGRSEYFRPGFGTYESDEAEEAARDDHLNWDDDEGGYWINIEDPQVAAADEAVRQLFDQRWSDDLEAWFRTTYSKTFSSSSRPVWSALRLL